MNTAIINPKREPHSPNVGKCVVMAAAEPDIALLCGLMGMKKKNSRKVVMSRLYAGNGEFCECSAIGPLTGAPYAVLLMEDVVGWGAEKIIFVGWCGAVSKDVSIGDIIVPNGAFIDEGTSRHYFPDESRVPAPSENLADAIKRELANRKIGFREGPIWTTDAIFRETREKLEHYQSKNVLAVEMEVSALFTAGEFRNAEVASILVVSDEISSGTWKKGFTDEKFKHARKKAAEVISNLCRNPSKTGSKP